MNLIDIMRSSRKTMQEISHKDPAVREMMKFVVRDFFEKQIEIRKKHPLVYQIQGQMWNA